MSFRPHHYLLPEHVLTVLAFLNQIKRFNPFISQFRIEIKVFQLIYMSKIVVDYLSLLMEIGGERAFLNLDFKKLKKV